MLYLDYSRPEGGWIPNRYGGRENLDAIEFLRRFNTEMFTRHPDATTLAEESTAWPMVSRLANARWNCSSRRAEFQATEECAAKIRPMSLDAWSNACGSSA